MTQASGGVALWRFAALLFCGSAGAGLLIASQARPPATRPNILIVQADDLGYGDLSAYGQAQFQTPALDRLAQDGIRFTHYYEGSTVCAPSRTALMTGLHTGHAWIRGNGDIPLREEDVTVAMALHDANLDTDPAEQRDVAGAHPDVVATFEAYFRTARTENSRWPVK